MGTSTSEEFKVLSRNTIDRNQVNVFNLSQNLNSFTESDTLYVYVEDYEIQLPRAQSQYVSITNLNCPQFKTTVLYKINMPITDSISFEFGLSSQSQVTNSAARFAFRNFQFTYEPQNSSVCYFTCNSCNSQYKSVCIDCNTSYTDRSLTNGQCLCREGYYEGMYYYCYKDNATCPITCSKCSTTSPKICTACNSSYNRVLSNGRCVCKDGYYQKINLSVCEQCHYSCKTCLSHIQRCLICEENRVKDATGYCVCQKGYYEQSNGTCAPCGLGCDVCIDNLTCSKCSSQNTKIVNGVCQCTDEYYYQIPSYTCYHCSVGCAKCQSATECIECKTNLGYYLSNGQCNCPDGTFDTGYQCTACNCRCATCSSLTKCITCPLPLELNNGNCLCRDGFFEDSFLSCKACNEKCSTCESLTKCLTCYSPDKYVVDSTNMCVCKDGMYESPLQKTCLSCNEKCSKCSDINNCTECKKNSGLTLIDQMCVCKSNEYFDSKDQMCKRCQKNCAQCTSFTTCLKCINDIEYDYNPIKQQCDCQIGYYIDEAEDKELCFKCHFSCKTCSYYNICIECAIIGTILDPYGNCDCPIGQYKNLTAIPNRCDKCLASCKTCNNGQSCSKCLNDTEFLMDIYGNCNCRKGYFMKENLCYKCNEMCSSCTSDLQCTSCISPTMKVINGLCSCQDGFFFDSVKKTCSACSKFCKQCIDAQTCIKCIDQDLYQISNNTCKCRTEGVFEKADGSCSPCEYSCLRCTNATSCISCKYLDTFLSPTTKLCTCGDGLNFDRVTNQCTKCFQGCKTCDSFLKCSECSDTISYELDPATSQCKCRKGYFLDNQGLCQQCDDMCSECIETKEKCTSCSYSDTKLLDHKCVCKEDKYYFDQNDKKCMKCYKFCNSCTTSETCISCLDNVKYEYEQQTMKCKCAPNYYIGYQDNLCRQCLPPFLIHENLYCLQQCPPNYYIFQNLCLKECPEDHVNINGICKRTYCDQTCKKCNSNKINCDQCVQNYNLMKDNTCKACDLSVEFYNSQAKECGKCDNSCDRCHGSTSLDCNKCKFAKSFIDTNKCVLSCEQGEYPFQIGDFKLCKTCYLQEGECQMDNCSQGYYIDQGNICVKCHPTCLQCKGTKVNECIVCRDELVYEQGRCIPCKYGFFFDQLQNSCTPCYYTCQECSGPKENQCKTCGFSLILSKISGRCLKKEEYITEIDQKEQADSIGCTSDDFSVCQQQIDFSANTFSNLKTVSVASASINAAFGLVLSSIGSQSWLYVQNHQILGNMKDSKKVVVLGIIKSHVKISSYFNIIPFFQSDSNNSSKEYQQKYLEDDNLENKKQNIRILQQSTDEKTNNPQGTISKPEREYFYKTCLIQLFIMGLLYLSVIILHYIRNKYQNAMKVYEYVKWNLILRYFMLFSNFFLYQALKEIILFDFTSIKSILSFSAASLQILLYLITYIFSLKFLINQKDFANNELRSSYSVLFQNLKIGYSVQRIFWVLFEIKKLSIIFVQYFFQDNPNLQIQIMIGINGVFLLYLIIMRPFHSVILQICCLFVEFGSIFFLVILMLLFLDPYNISLSTNFIYSLIVYEGLVCTLSLIQALFKVIEILRQKRMKQIQDQQNNSNILMGFKLDINIDSFLSASPVKTIKGPAKLILKKNIHFEMEKR